MICTALVILTSNDGFRVLVLLAAAASARLEAEIVAVQRTAALPPEGVA